MSDLEFFKLNEYVTYSTFPSLKGVTLRVRKWDKVEFLVEFKSSISSEIIQKIHTLIEPKLSTLNIKYNISYSISPYDDAPNFTDLDSNLQPLIDSKLKKGSLRICIIDFSSIKP